MFFYNNIWYIFILCKWLFLIYFVRLNLFLFYLIFRINNKWWCLCLLFNLYSGVFICYFICGVGFVFFFCCMRICIDIWLMYIDFNIWCCIWLLFILCGCVFVYCSSFVGMIVGVVIGGLFVLVVVIGIIVFICVVVCKCKMIGVRGWVV